MPKKVKKYLAQRLHSIAGWTKGSVNRQRWRAAAHKALEASRAAADDA